MITASLLELMSRQSGVISRRQVHEHGGEAWDIKRLLRRREWVRLLPGVYLSHTGEPTWTQRAWAGVLAAWPAALADESALRAAIGPAWRGHVETAPIRLVVEADRKAVLPAGYRVRRSRTFGDGILWNAGPPRLRAEAATWALVSRQTDEMATIALLADVCQRRVTTPARLASALSSCPRMSRRRWLDLVVRDLELGTRSVLEHGYLTRVERAHGLPRGTRQQESVVDGATRFTDVQYDAYGLVVELDGRLFHDDARQRDADLDRDLDAAVQRRLTVRLGWGQVFGRACRTAGQVGLILVRRGWTGQPVPCGPGCGLAG